MKTSTIALIAVASLWSSHAMADGYTSGYLRNDGSYVQGYYHSSPNSTTLDNYSTRGNINPYTGRRGTQNPYRRYRYRSPYSSRQRSYSRDYSYGNNR